MESEKKTREQMRVNRSPHFLCRIFGHQHETQLQDDGDVTFSSHCSRCFIQIPLYANRQLTFNGDWVLLCKLLGHKLKLKNTARKKGTLWRYTLIEWCCWRCHKTTLEWNKRATEITEKAAKHQATP